VNYKQSNPTRLYFGAGSIENLKAEIKEAKNVLLTYGKGSVKKQGLYDEVLDILKKNEKNVFELSGIKPNPDITSVYEGIDICKKQDIDLILAIGGGSVIDCSKIIAIGSKYDGDMWQRIKNKQFDLTEKIKLGTILTNSATSSENNYYAVISNEKETLKLGTAFWPVAHPDFSILDPKYTVSLPLAPTVEGVADISSHLMETYFHGQDTENAIVKIVDAELEALIKGIVTVGPKLVHDLSNLEYRETVMFLASQGLSTRLRHVVNGDWACHAMEHALSAVYDIPHGGGLAVLTPNWMDYIAPKRTPKLKQMAINIFGVSSDGKTDIQIATEGIEAFRKFLSDIGAPKTLGYYGIEKSSVDTLVEKALGGGEQIGLMCPLNADAVKEIITASL